MHSALYLKLILVNLFKIRMAFANCTNVTTIIVLIVSCVFGYVMYLPKKYVILRILLFKGIHLTLYSSIMKITLFFGGIYLEYVHTAHSQIFDEGYTRSDPFLKNISVHNAFCIHSCFYKRYTQGLIKFIEIQRQQSKQSYHKTCYQRV